MPDLNPTKPPLDWLKLLYFLILAIVFVCSLVYVVSGQKIAYRYHGFIDHVSDYILFQYQKEIVPVRGRDYYLGIEIFGNAMTLIGVIISIPWVMRIRIKAGSEFSWGALAKRMRSIFMLSSISIFSFAIADVLVWELNFGSRPSLAIRGMILLPLLRLTSPYYLVVAVRLLWLSIQLPRRPCP